MPKYLFRSTLKAYNQDLNFYEFYKTLHTMQAQEEILPFSFFFITTNKLLGNTFILPKSHTC